MTLGILARCDQGGLAALTREVHRHLEPERTLLIEVPGANRGGCEPADYQSGQVYRTEYRGKLSSTAVEWATAEGIDVLWTAEFWYGDAIVRTAHHHAIQTVMLTMPELAGAATSSPDFGREVVARVLHVPTHWRQDTLPNATLLPVPVARDRLPYRARTSLRHLYHQVGTPFGDRNGTQILLDALPFITTDDLRVTIRADRYIDVPACKIHVEVVGGAEPDYWNVWPDDVDLFVQPRRYGGLSLPVQEAASLGVPSVMLQSDPYAELPFCTTIPVTGSNLMDMKGGKVPVHSADPRVLARAIDYLAEHPSEVVDGSKAADRWAVEHDWAGPLGGRWAHLLRASVTPDR